MQGVSYGFEAPGLPGAAGGLGAPGALGAWDMPGALGAGALGAFILGVPAGLMYGEKSHLQKGHSISTTPPSRGMAFPHSGHLFASDAEAFDGLKHTG